METEERITQETEFRVEHDHGHGTPTGIRSIEGSPLDDGCCDDDDDCCPACAAAKGSCDDDEEDAGRLVRFGSYTLPLKRLAVFAAALLLWAAGIAAQHFCKEDGGWIRYLPLLPFVSAYALAGLPVLRNAFRYLWRRKRLDENFLMTTATIGAFIIGEWEEAVGVMIFYMIGELIQEAAVNRSRRSIKSLLALKPDIARVETGPVWTEVGAETVAVGAVVLVRPGERIPLDGIVIQGEGAIDGSMLSGESRPVDVKAGDEVSSGTVSVDSVLLIRTTRTAENSSAAKIIALVESARNTKAKPEKFITAFAKWYTPIVVAGAVLIAVLPPLLISGARFADWIYRALILLVISCPCALVVSIPLGYFAGIGGLSRRGIMVKGAVHLDSLHKARFVAFDKTGTLTQGKFAITALEPVSGVSGEMLLETAVLAERESNHPIAQAIRAGGLSRGIGGDRLTVTANGAAGSNPPDYREIAGRGIELSPGGEADRVILAGNRAFLEERGVAVGNGGANPAGNGAGADTAVYIAREGHYYGRILVGDTDREGAREAVARLGKLGIQETLMVTGDTPQSAEAAAKRLGISAVKAGLLPGDKLSVMEELTRQGTTVFVGDGINDAPVLARSDVGIAIGSGADAAVEAADVIIMTGDPRRVPEAIERARRTRGIILGNVVFALGAKGFFIILAVLGMTNLWLALFADVGVCLLAVLNSTRALR